MELTNLQFNHPYWPYIIVVLCCLGLLVNVYGIFAFCKRRLSHPLRGVLQALLVEDAALCGFVGATLVIMVLMRLGYGEGDSLLPQSVDSTIERYFRDLDLILHPHAPETANLTTQRLNGSYSFNLTFENPDSYDNSTEVAVDLPMNMTNWTDLAPFSSQSLPTVMTSLAPSSNESSTSSFLTSPPSSVNMSNTTYLTEEATSFSVLQSATYVQYDWLRYFYFAIRIQHLSVIWLVLPLSYLAVSRQPHYCCILLALVLVKLFAALYNVIRIFEIGVTDGPDRTFMFYRHLSDFFGSTGYDIAYFVGGFWVWHLFLPIILLLGSWIGFCVRWPGTCLGASADVRRMTLLVQLLFLATHLPFFILWLLYDDWVLDHSPGVAKLYTSEIAWLCNLLVVLNSVLKPIAFLTVSGRWRQSAFGCYCHYCCCCCCACCRKLGDTTSSSTITSPGAGYRGVEEHEVHDLLPKD